MSFERTGVAGTRMIGAPLTLSSAPCVASHATNIKSMMRGASVGNPYVPSGSRSSSDRMIDSDVLHAVDREIAHRHVATRSAVSHETACHLDRRNDDRG
ncbi:hypothetical protein [Burkholderia territorii]|uniref:hypothetical protein n=1 Tax=Burkholderia territorii TaxID=1503055 RepID=UPI0012D9CD48|nr:hypothetical protein [Burkholderia territorii]